MFAARAVKPSVDHLSSIRKDAPLVSTHNQLRPGSSGSHNQLPM